MRGDPGVDDGDVGVDALVDAVDVGEARLQGADPRDAGRGRLGGDQMTSSGTTARTLGSARRARR